MQISLATTASVFGTTPAPSSPLLLTQIAPRSPTTISGVAMVLSSHRGSAGRRGISLGDAMALSGHRGAAVALRYHQAGSALANPAARLAD